MYQNMFMDTFHLMTIITVIICAKPVNVLVIQVYAPATNAEEN